MRRRNDAMLWMYRMMATSRRYEERIREIYLEGKSPLFNMANGPIPGEMHLSNGQEPCAVGVCAHLVPEDFVTATHRSHHVAIAKGVNLKAMTAEIFGKVSGLSGGRGGHMHLFDPSVNFSCSGIIAQGMGPAVGAALAFRMRGESRVAVAYVGEGAVNQGAWHEAMNLAALWQLPFICIIEDNGWGVSVPKSGSTAVSNNAARAAAYNMCGFHILGNDPVAVYDAAGEAIGRARAGGGPSLIEIETFRLEGHFMGDTEGYRPEGEKDALWARDALPLLRQKIINEGLVSEDEAADLDVEAWNRVEEAISFARASNPPPPESALTALFVEGRVA